MSYPEPPQQSQPPAYAPPVAYGTPTGYGAPVNPGKGLGIAGFVLALLGPLSLVGLILSIVAFVKSRKAGQPNGLALAGIIVGAIVLVITIIVSIVIGVGVAHVIEVCNDLGNGVHVVDGVTYRCNF